MTPGTVQSLAHMAYFYKSTTFLSPPKAVVPRQILYGSPSERVFKRVRGSGVFVCVRMSGPHNLKGTHVLHSTTPLLTDLGGYSCPP